VRERLRRQEHPRQRLRLRRVRPSRASAYEAGEGPRSSSRSRQTRAAAEQAAVPALVGLCNKPTAVNNVETLCNVPLIVKNGAEECRPRPEEQRPEAAASAAVKRPGVYEASMNITLRGLIEGHAGGVRDGRR
jgi:NADH-quinone oxidoreductase subunit F